MFLAFSILALSITNTGLCKDESKTTEPLKVGDKATDFEIETFDGKKVKLSDRFGKENDDGRPVVLLFSRAHW
jgi:hypothetical protein